MRGYTHRYLWIISVTTEITTNFDHMAKDESANSICSIIIEKLVSMFTLEGWGRWGRSGGIKSEWRKGESKPKLTSTMKNQFSKITSIHYTIFKCLFYIKGSLMPNAPSSKCSYLDVPIPNFKLMMCFFVFCKNHPKLIEFNCERLRSK